MHYKVLYPSKYLAAHEFGGKDVTLTIRRVIVETVETKEKKESKPCVYFVETQRRAERDGTEEKRLIMNKTNAVTIAGMYGNEVNDWTGKRITLFATTVNAFGKDSEAIRVRPIQPPAKMTQPTEPEPAQPQPETK